MKLERWACWIANRCHPDRRERLEVVAPMVTKSSRMSRDAIALWANRKFGREGRDWRMMVRANGLPSADCTYSTECIEFGRV